jgi:hypothetical protein
MGTISEYEISEMCFCNYLLHSIFYLIAKKEVN